VHASGRRLPRSLCAVIAWGAARRGCLAGASRCQQGPASFGRGRPQHTVDLALGTTATAAPSPFWSFAPLCTAVACRGSRVAVRSLSHVALLSRPRIYVASPHAWAPAACPPCVVASSAPAGLPSLLRTVAMTRTRSASSSACHHPFSIPLVHGFGLTSFGQATPPRLNRVTVGANFGVFPPTSR
jgi:hypothetical protein